MPVFFIDKTTWRRGPWNDEPDELHFTTLVGTPGLILRGLTGHLCGYAGVTEDHPLHGVGWTDLDAHFEVHGGLTFSGPSVGERSVLGHPNLWWFGFDCAHAGDFVPAWTAKQYSMLASIGFLMRGKYRDIRYVRDEIESLALQLISGT